MGVGERPDRVEPCASLPLQGGLAATVRPDVAREIAVAEAYLTARDRWIERSSEIKGGIPVIAGTRISVYGVADRIADGDSVEELSDEFPDDPGRGVRDRARLRAVQPAPGSPTCTPSLARAGVRLFVDENLSPTLAGTAHDHGYDGTSSRDRHLLGLPDHALLRPPRCGPAWARRCARRHGRTAR